MRRARCVVGWQREYEQRFRYASSQPIEQIAARFERMASNFSRPQRAPTVVINPATDTEFEAHVKSLLPDVSTPESLEEALHEQYPLVVVHRRELSSEPITIWYVYRDGRWRR